MKRAVVFTRAGRPLVGWLVWFVLVCFGLVWLVWLVVWTGFGLVN